MILHKLVSRPKIVKGEETLAMGSSRFLLFFCSLLVSLATLTLSQDDPLLVRNCNETVGNFTTNSTYQANLDSIISQLSSPTQFNYGFFNLSAGESPDKVNAIALCRGDLDQQECKSCLNYTATELERNCPSNKEATAWSERCMVRYANRDMYGLLENDPRTCLYNVNNASNPDRFNQALSDLLNNLNSQAAAGGPLRKYAAGNAQAGNSQTVYATVQCTPDMDQQNCSRCLNFAINEFRSCCQGRIGCRVLRPTCFLRFETNPFYNQTGAPEPSPLPAPLPALTPTTTSPPTSGNENNTTRNENSTTRTETKTTRTVIIVIASVVGVLIQLSYPYTFL